MKSDSTHEQAKRNAGEQAANAVEDGDVVGLGTGSTTAHAIQALGEAVDDGKEITAIPTSFQSRQLALECGISLTSLDAVDRIDIAIDGADQLVDTSGSHPGTLIKGGGAAHTREKLVDAAADQFLVVVDPSKIVDSLSWPVPIEVIPEAHTVVADRITALGGDPTLRSASCKDGPVVTDNGNLVLDCEFGTIDDPSTLAASLSALPGVLEHGLFLDLTDVAYVGTDDGVERVEF